MKDPGACVNRPGARLNLIQGRSNMDDRTCSVVGCGRTVFSRSWCVTHYRRWLKTGDVQADRPIRDRTIPLEDRFWAQVERRGDDECWPWRGCAPEGDYGRFWVGRGHKPPDQKAHRFSYELAKGPIPDGLQVDHICHNRDLSCPGGDPCQHRLCVNPAHLEAVTSRVNATRSHREHYWARTKVCTKGHPLTPDNVRYVNGGRVVCRQCAADRYHARRQKFWEQGLTATGEVRRTSVIRSVVARHLGD